MHDRSRDDRQRRRERGGLVLWLPLVAALLVVAVYGSQVGLGRWQSDEYNLFAAERHWNWPYMLARLSYSPRPVSELLIFLYGQAVAGWHRPLMTECLGGLWAGSIGCVVAASALGAGRARAAAGPALALSFFAFVLVTNQVTEAFYWPASALAYMPTIAGPAAALFLLAGAPTPARLALAGLALLAAALSSEVGAAIAIGVAGAASCLAVWGRVTPRRTDLWWAVPGAAGLWVMGEIVRHRATVDELGASARPTTGHLLASIGAAARQMAIDVVHAGAGVAIPAAVAAKILFVAGFALVAARFAGARPGRWSAALACGLFVGAFFSLFAAFYHYGNDCCERQATTREALLDLFLVVAATALLARIAVSRVPGWLGPVLLAASLFPFAWRVGALRADAANYRFAVDSRAKTWGSAADAGSGTMKFFLPPDAAGMLIRGTWQPPGTYALAQGAPDMLGAVGRFFGKSTVIVCQPWQTEKSWLLRGQFIPACPPHGGKPDIVYDGP